MRLLLVSILFLALVSCGDDNKSANTEPVDYKVQNEADIKIYIEENSLEVQKSESGLYYVINELGTGTSAYHFIGCYGRLQRLLS